MSQIQVDNIYNKEATGSPSFPLGANVTGVITATTFKGGAEITSGTISATSVTAASGTFNGPVTIGGTLTYEDVTNIDSVGVITARNGLKVTTGGIDIDGGGIDITGNIGLGGATYGTAGEVLTSGGSGANATWTAISAAPEITLNAAGNINAGTALVVNSSGQLTGITSETVPADSGFFKPSASEVTSDSSAVDLIIGSSTQYNVLAHDPDNAITIFQFKGSNNATRQVAYKLAKDGSWTHGSESELSNQNYGYSSLCYAGQGRFVAFYIGTSQTGKCRVLTVNTSTLAITIGSEISLGQPAGVLSVANNNPVRCIWHPPTNKIVFVCHEGGDTKYVASTGTMNYSSNTVDTWGPDKYTIFTDNAEILIDTNDSTTSKNLAYDPDTQKVIFGAQYNGSNGSYSAVAMTVNTNGSVSMGSRLIVSGNPAIPQGNTKVDYDKLHNKVVFQWRYNNNFYARTATVAANGTMTANAILTLATGQTSASCNYSTMAGDSNGVAALFYSETAYGNIKLKIFKIASNGTLTLGSGEGEITYSGTLRPEYSLYDSAAGRVIMEFYESSGDSKLIGAKISKVNTTSGGYVGIANTTVTNGQSLVARTFGSTSTYHTGLSTGSTYYLQSNGNFSTTADDPSVIGGVALNGTTLLVRS